MTENMRESLPEAPALDDDDNPDGQAGEVVTVNEYGEEAE